MKDISKKFKKEKKLNEFIPKHPNVLPEPHNPLLFPLAAVYLSYQKNKQYFTFQKINNKFVIHNI
jgi:hypothetical protein